MWHSFVGATLLGLAAAKVYDTPYGSTTWDDDNWRIATTTLVQGDFHSRMSLANGYLGINVASIGPFFEFDTAEDLVNEWPLFDRRQTFATIAGFYDSQPDTNGTNFPWLLQYGGESVISGIPHWAGLYVQSGDAILNSNVSSEHISNFSSTLDIKRGLMHWNYTWTPNGDGTALDVEYAMFVHKLHVNQATVQLRLTAQEDVNVTLIDVLDGDAAVRTNAISTNYDNIWPIISSAVSPIGVDNVTAHVYSALLGDDSCDTSSRQQVTTPEIIGTNSSSVGQSIVMALKAGQVATAHKFIGAASDDAFDEPDAQAYVSLYQAATDGFDAMLESHVAEWAYILTPDSVDSFRDPETGDIPDDENILERQIVSITNTFYILQNTVGAHSVNASGNNTHLAVNSIPVCGLGDSCYGGEIFWDTEVWMAPGLVVNHPESTRQVYAYRLAKYAQAQANIATAYQSSKNNTHFSPNSAIFPWVSSRYGNCTSVGPCWDYEYHLNGDIGLSFIDYLVTSGNTEYFRDELFPVFESIAQLYADILTYNDTADAYYLLNGTDPDEFANHQDNVAFTMALIQVHLNTTNMLRERFGLAANESWTNISSQVYPPVDDNAQIIKEYESMNGSISVKQADVILIDDFIDFPNPYSLNDLEYYAGKQSLNGPGMTYGVFSIVANQYSPSGCSAFTYDLYGTRPYVRAPWLQYSEQLIDDPAVTGFHPAFPFLTGSGGALRVSVFGYLGLRLELDSFHVNPNLPPQIANLDFRTLYWQGWPVNATANRTHTTLSRGETPLATANTTFADSDIPVTVGQDETVLLLGFNNTLTIENRNIGAVKTVPGNVAQCLPVTTDSEYSDGQFPLAAVDGAVSTKWQPAYLNTSASITVQLSEPFVPITEVRFDWAQNVPASFSVSFSNSTNSTNAVNVTSSSDIDVSSPYDASTADAIVPYSSNTTNVTLDSPVWSGRYATLTISGNQALEGTADERNGTGATVAEFALVAADS
ncbi:carbohydrate-binding module family 32 protein [Polychaeton citri CBS 116435]|uniref:alpha,alpha-trehalase n=1 Tax=Polychaeton citri CBS 116435 TaxID=1314669 RepID=A0A9P4QGQ0_9PEZI|nr:carbohydrate-binding module family 32 protein [Polychaeton citri CBS 116435]